MHKASAAVAVTAALALAAAGCSTKSTAKSSESTGASGSTSSAAPGKLGQGVTATTIKLGITYVDLKAISSAINIDHGDYPTAWKALVDEVNASGGINGRKIDPVIVPINPISSAPAAEACTKLTEDEKVFAVVGFFLGDAPLCYVKTHDTPIVGVSLTEEQQQEARAPWFNSSLSTAHLIPKEMDVFAKRGVFKGHKVAVVAQTNDQSDMQNLVLPELKKLGVKVVQSAVNDAPSTDLPALYQRYALITQKFQGAGADVVIMVGDAAGAWPRATQVNRSDYRPRLIATDETRILTYSAGNPGYDPSLLTGALAAASQPPSDVIWNDPKIQDCVATVKAAHPDEPIRNPLTSKDQHKATWVSVENNCEQMALFTAIAKAAGPTLNNETFLRGGESLKNIDLPGAGGTMHFGPGHHDGDGPVFIYSWNDANKDFELIK